VGKRKDNLKSGFGKIKWEDGSILLSNFVKNKAEGVGLFRNQDGSTFNGKNYLK
jgi:hypothetical protein